jgi:hypothetical protein
MTVHNDLQRQLTDRPWVVLRNPQDLNDLLGKIHFDSLSPLGEVQTPEGFPCLAKYVLMRDQIYMVYLGEQDAIDFLKCVHTPDRLEGDQPVRQDQDGFNRQMAALLMALVKLVINAKLCTKEQFEMWDVQFQGLVDQEVTDYKAHGGDPNTAAFLRKLFSLTPQ